MEISKDLEAFLQMPAYGVSRKEKRRLLEGLLKNCMRHHSAGCPEYGSYLDALGRVGDTGAEEEIPFLPVSIFKERDLKSIPDEEVFKVITSSGTSGQRPSRIYLDAGTSALQQKVLARIAAEEIGGRRLPCLILDTRAVLRDRKQFSARGAGILGFSMFASRTCYALDENMNLNLEEIRTFIEANREKALARGEPPKFLLYGFTFMIWQYFVRALEEQSVSLDLAGSVLIHGGGWKKLQSQAVSPEEFAARIRAATGIETVRSYYGMAEQTGCICMECACGHLHTSTWSDVIVRRETDYSVCGIKEPGILQVLTPIAMSYPGHSLLTEDRGVLLGEDDCPCGRKGKYFRVMGRLPRAEIRGCSDTFETGAAPRAAGEPGVTGVKNLASARIFTLTDHAARQSGTARRKPGTGFSDAITGDWDARGTGTGVKNLASARFFTLLAGVRSTDGEAWEPFAPQTIGFLDAFSRALREDVRARQDPETMALAFWCRRAHILLLREKYGMGRTDLETGRESIGRGDIPMADISTKRAAGTGEGRFSGTGELRLGRGRIFHLAPANVPMMFAYTWIMGLLAGNAGIVRISDRTLQREAVRVVLDVLNRLFTRDEFQGIRRRTSLITYDRSDAVTEQILQSCDGRVLWGGDETIRQMRRIPMPAHAVELAFPDRVSLAVISEEALSGMEEEQIRSLAHRFYNDTYLMDQNGCSSPQTVVWLKSDRGGASAAGPSVREKWWALLAAEAERSYENDGFRAARKLEKAALAAMDFPGSGDRKVRIRRLRGNVLYVLSLSGMPEDLAACRGGFGLFFETEADSAEQIFRSFSKRIQTVVCIGADPHRMAERAAQNHSEGVLRFVEPGQALQIDTVWDGIDLIRALSRGIQ